MVPSMVPDDSVGEVTLVLGTDSGVGDLRTVQVKRASGDASATGTSEGGSTGESTDGPGSGGTSTADKATCAS